MQPSLLRRGALAAALATLAACGGDRKAAPEPPRATTIEAVTSVTMTAIVGADVPEPPTVRVRDQAGRPMAGVSVVFGMYAYGGSIQQLSAFTGSDGTASVLRWTLGPTSGQQQLAASVGSLTPLVFTTNALPGPLSRIAAAWGGTIGGTVGDPSPRTANVLALDSYGNVVSGVTVAFNVVAGGGSVANPTSTTGAAGTATPGAWTMGPTPGSNILSASVPASPAVTPVSFTVDAGPGVPATIVADVTIDSVGIVASDASAAPAVIVKDRFGNAAAGRTVTFDALGGTSTVAAATVAADSAGRASAGRWTLGTRAGIQQVRATGAPGVELSFSVRALPGPASTVTTAVGNGQRGHVSTTLPVVPAARVTDAWGNAVAGVDVTVAVGDGGGSIGGSGGTSDADGLVPLGSWTLGPAAGRNTLLATGSGIAAPATFVAIGGGGEPAQSVVLAGTGQTGPVATVLPIEPKLRYVDADGIAVNEYDVRFQAASGVVTRTTDANGEVSAPWTLGTTAGEQQLYVAAGGVSDVLRATAVPGPPGRTTQLTGADQIQLVGTTLAVAPSVRVSDAYGNVRTGDVVTFEVTSGSGSITGATATADASGVARLGSWTLGASEGINGVTPVIGGFRGGEIIAKAVPPSSFDITLRYLAGGGSEYAASFERAAARWRKVVIGDMPDFTATGQKFCASSATDQTYPVLNETIDDVLIFVRIEKIDGPGKTLAQAGACALRAPAGGGYGSGIPIAGTMRLDIDDLQALLASGRIDDVILHEMGHVLGIGSLWEGTPFFHLAVGTGGADPYFTGPSGRAGFAAAGGNAYGGNPVPIENQGAPGTRDAHWRESALDVELMTGFVEPSNVRMPLSLTTIGSLEDMGYVVTAYGDDRYRFGEVALITSTRRAGGSTSGFEFLELPAPMPIAIDRDGTVRPLSSVRFWNPPVRRVPSRLRVGAFSR